MLMCIFPSMLRHVLVRQQEGHPACKETRCWFVGGDDLLELCTRYSSSCHHHFHHLSSNKIQSGDVLINCVTQIYLENGRKNGQREQSVRSCACVV